LATFYSLNTYNQDKDMFMKNTALIFLLCFSTYAHAEWYEDKSIEWWMVVYSKMQCSKAADVGRRGVRKDSGYRLYLCHQ